MAVIAPAGVVGRIIMPTARASKVQLLIDRDAAAGVMVERSRASGVVRVGHGTGVGSADRLEYVSGTADVKVGDRVVTSGIDGIYPKGFVIGEIQSVERGAGECAHQGQAGGGLLGARGGAGGAQRAVAAPETRRGAQGR